MENDYSYCEDEREEAFWRSWDAVEIERRPFDQAEFDAFRADPKRKALIERIFAEIDQSG